MKAIVQHNFTSGMGDFINCIYEYFITCNRLKQCGITHFTLFFYLEKNVYLHKDQFWDIFYEKTFLQLFDVVEIIEKSIETDAYENCVCITGNPGKHLWDLFLEKGYSDECLHSIKKYSYTRPECDFLDIFTPTLMKKYKELNTLKDYDSIYYRTLDLQNQEETYPPYENKLKNILTKKVYVSSNSYKFKKYVCNFGNCIMYTIPEEDKIGNHYNYNREFYNEKDIIKQRTEYVIFEMLTLSDSNKIHFFTNWNGRPSNFLLLALIKNKCILNETNNRI